MAMHIDTSNAGASGDASHGYDAPDLRVFVIALFFIFGGITSLNDIIIPKLKELFTLDHATSMLVQSAFFLAYALFSLPAAAIVRRAGYMRTASIGLVTMMVGCLLFILTLAIGLVGCILCIPPLHIGGCSRIITLSKDHDKFPRFATKFLAQCVLHAAHV